MGLRPALGLGVLLAALLGGCTRTPMLPHTLHLPAQTLSLPGAQPVQDGRVRFRQIFCGLVAARFGATADCGEWLLRLGDEPAGAAAPPPAPPLSPDAVPGLKLVLIPGLFDECVRDLVPFYGEALPRLRARGYDLDLLPVNSRSGSGYNAARIATYVAALPTEPGRRLVLLGHSKGAADILHFLVAYPEAARRVAAVASLAGAVNGSPLADWVRDDIRGWESLLPANWCDPGDEQALQSLTRLESLSWLAANPLPSGPRYLSLGAISDTDDIAWPLRYAYARLAEIDPRNDGLLLFSDQVIPGADLLGYAAADHWRVAYPIEQHAAFLAAGREPRPPFPRELLLEAVIHYTAEVLNHAPH